MVDANKKPMVETEEIATIKRDPYNPLFSGLINQNDDTLASRGQGKGIKLYEEIERDAHVFSCLHKRKMAVISRPWEVTPASESRLDKKAAEIVRIQLEALNFDALCLGLLDAINKGFSVGEIIWQPIGAETVADELRLRDQRRFVFGENYELRLKTQENMLTGEEMPARKFVVHSIGAKDGNPYGLGLGSKLFWPVWFKRQGITFWLTFLDKFGSPTAVGKYPSGTQPPEQQKLLDALGAISQDAGVAIPEGMVIELLEATRGGTAGYESMCRYMDEQISYCVLGESAGAKNSGGALASAAITRNEVRLELVQFDADLLSATLNDTLVKWISEFNIPGATPPTVWRKVTEPEDLKLRAERDKILVDMGFRPSLNYVRDTYGGDWELAPIPAPAVVAPTLPNAAKPDAASFSEPAPSITSDALSVRLETEAADAWDAVMGHLSDLVEQADSMEGLQKSITESYSGLPLDDLRQVMARALQVAALAGMADVKDGLNLTQEKPIATGITAFSERLLGSIFKARAKEKPAENPAHTQLLKQLADNQTAFAEALAAIGKGEKHFTINIEQKQGKTTKTIKLDETTGNYIVTENEHE